MMCELPTNALLADQYLEYFDGMSIGSNDMTQLTLGLDRDSAIDRAPVRRARRRGQGAARAWRSRPAARPASTSASAARARRTIPDLARWLVEQGIESMSLNPDTVVETWLFLAGEGKSGRRRRRGRVSSRSRMSGERAWHRPLHACPAAPARTANGRSRAPQPRRSQAVRCSAPRRRCSTNPLASTCRATSIDPCVVPSRRAVAAQSGPRVSSRRPASHRDHRRHPAAARDGCVHAGTERRFAAGRLRLPCATGHRVLRRLAINRAACSSATRDVTAPDVARPAQLRLQRRTTVRERPGDVVAPAPCDVSRERGQAAGAPPSARSGSLLPRISLRGDEKSYRTAPVVHPGLHSGSRPNSARPATATAARRARARACRRRRTRVRRPPARRARSARRASPKRAATSAEEVRRRLAFDRRIGREDHFLHLAVAEQPLERLDADLAADRRRRAATDVPSARSSSRGSSRTARSRRRPPATRRRTAGCGRGLRRAQIGQSSPSANIRQRLAVAECRPIAALTDCRNFAAAVAIPLEQVEGHALRGLRPDARQAAQRLDQPARARAGTASVRWSADRSGSFMPGGRFMPPMTPGHFLLRRASRRAARRR